MQEVKGESEEPNVCYSTERRVASSGCLADKRLISEPLVNIECPDVLSSVTLHIDEMSARRCADMSTIRMFSYVLLSSIKIASWRHTLPLNLYYRFYYFSIQECLHDSLADIMDQNFDLLLTEFFFIIVEKCNLYYWLGHFFYRAWKYDG